MRRYVSCVGLLWLLVGTGAGVEPTQAAHGYLGVVIPTERVDVASEVAGRIRTMAVALGDSVSEGQLLVEIEVPGLARQILQAEAAVAGARSSASQIAIELKDIERQLELRSHTDDVFSKEELEALDLQRQIKGAELDEANATTEAKEAELDLLRERHAALRIEAPFAGVVALRQADAESYVMAGESLLRLTGSAPSIIRFAVPAGEAEWLVPGAEVDVGLDTEREPDTLLPAVVLRVAPEIDPASEMFFAEASFVREAGSAGARAAKISNGSVVRVRRR